MGATQPLPWWRRGRTMHAAPPGKALTRAPPLRRPMDWRSALLAQRKAKGDTFRRDPGSPIPPGERASFRGLSYYPPDPRHRFEAPLVRDTPKPLDIQRSGGDVV